MNSQLLHKALNLAESRIMSDVKDRALAEIRKEMTGEMRSLFREQSRLFLKEFSEWQSEFVESFNVDDSNRIFGKVKLATLTKLTDTILKGTEKGMAKGYNRLSKAVGWGIDLSFDLKNPRAVDYLRKNAAEKVTAINETTRKEIARIVTKGTEEGTSYAKMAKEIRGKFSEFSVPKPQLHIRDRAELVSVTETANAYGEGNMIFAQDLQDKGLVMVKSWQTVGDDRVSDGCQENQDAGWIGVDEMFPSGDEHEPRFPGCRCTCLYDTRVAM